MKEQDKTSEMEIRNLPDKEFKVIFIKMLTELGRRMDEHSENFNKDIENIKYQIDFFTEVKNKVTELKSTLIGVQQIRCSRRKNQSP